jgi:hypothetical protein
MSTTARQNVENVFRFSKFGVVEDSMVDGK